MICRSRVVLIATVLVLCVVAVLTPDRGVSPVAAASSPGRAWLALGDSYSAGTGIDGSLDPGGPGRDCRRADGKAGRPKAWAVGAYDKVKQDDRLDQIDFVPCNGAITDDAFTPGRGVSQSMEAQYLNVPGVPTGSRRWDVVSFTFGGNNLGFADVLRGCVDAFENWLEPDRNPGCDVDKTTLEKRVDQLTDTPRGTTGADLVGSVNIPTLLDDVAGLVNPNGQVIMVGYPRFVRDPFLFGGPLLCEGLNRDGYTMLNDVVDHLNERLGTAIDDANDRHGGKQITFTFVDAADEIDGHELCSDQPWLTGITLAPSIAKGIDFTTSFHPNQSNHDAIANAVAAKIDLQVDDTPTDAQQVDWRNRAYTTDCAGIEPSPITLTLNGGAASNGSDLGDHELRVLDVAIGDLTGDGVAEAAVLILCKPQGTSPNLYGVEAQVFSGDGQMLGGPLEARADVPGSSEYGSYLNGEPFRIDQGRILTGADFRTDGQCNACPADTRTLIWTWNPDTRSFSLS